MRKKAIITGVTGQDGTYLADMLLKKNYIVHGIVRRSSTSKIERWINEFQYLNQKVIIHNGDVCDSANITEIISSVKPNEIYNFAAQSHVAVSFNSPEYTSNANALGALRILDAIRILKLEKKTKFYQASTSELYGMVREKPQTEKTPFYPRSPYAVAKLYSYWITKNYRESYGIFATNGILFNHESKLRGETFVTRKITIGLAEIAKNKIKKIEMGNLEALRDWGHAKDYVYAIWLMLQDNKPDDYVISSETQYSVKDFINITAFKLGIKIKWSGKGLKETGKVKEIFKSKFGIPDVKVNQTIISVNKKYFRNSEVPDLIGDCSKIRKKLKWKPKITFEKLIEEMIEWDFEKI